MSSNGEDETKRKELYRQLDKVLRERHNDITEISRIQSEMAKLGIHWSVKAASSKHKDEKKEEE